MNPLQIGIALAMAALVALAGYEALEVADVKISLAAEKLAHSDDLKRLTQAALDQTNAFRVREHTWQLDQERHDVEQAAKVQALQHDVDGLAASRDSFMRYARSLAAASRAAPAGAPAQPGSSPTEAPGDLLANLLSGTDGFADAVAQYADRARIAGERCQADYISVSGP